MSTPDADWCPTTLSVASWVTYDLANTIFALGVSGLYFASWFTDEGWPDGGLAVAIASAMVVVIVLSPWIGARSDHSDRRVRYLIPTTLTAVVATFFLASASVAVSLALYVIAVIGFNLGSVIYDSLLPDVSTPENRGFVSGLGVGIGYVGSIVAVGIGALLLDRFGYPAVFRSIAVAFLVFALPAFFFIRERPRVPPPGQPAALRSSLRKLVSSWRLARTYQGVVPFLLGRFLYTDAINTLIGGFLTIYVKQELDFSDSEVEALLALSILTAIIGGLTGGKLTDRRGPRRQLHMALYLWIAGIAGGILAVLLDMPPPGVDGGGRRRLCVGGNVDRRPCVHGAHLTAAPPW